MAETRCKMHKELHIGLTKHPEKASVCGHEMAGGGYALCHACAESQGRCIFCNERVNGGAEPPAAPTT